MSVMQPAVFFDGQSSRRRLVTLTLAERLEIADADAADGTLLASWPYDALRRVDGPTDVLRLTCITAAPLARLEIRDATARSALLRRCPALDGPGTASVSTWRIAAASIAAAVAIVAMVWFGMPLVADQLTTVVPYSWEKPLGDAVDPSVRRLFGAVCEKPDGAAALRKLVAQLQAIARLPNPPEIVVLRSDIPNALAAPGGRIYLLSALLTKAETADELAGVLAHELGHVEGRDGLRALIREGGTSFLIGLLFGDVTGAGVVLMAGRMVLSATHTRAAEESADAFAVRTMHALGRPTAPTGMLLERITGSGAGGMPSILRSHPLTPDRRAMLDAEDRPPTGPELLDAGEWRALKHICDR